MARRIYIIAKGEQVDQAVLDAASAANCPEIVRGVPFLLKGIVTEDMLPHVFEEPEQPEPRPTNIRHWAIVDGFQMEEKPLVVKREWPKDSGIDVVVECYVSQDLKDAYDAGNLAIGDFVIVDFIDGKLDKPFASQKVYKSWS